MPVKVLIPTPLRPYTDQKEAVEIEGALVRDLLDNLTDRYRDLRKHLFDDSGKLRSFVNVYVNEDDIRSLDRFETAVAETDVVSIVPSIAGGAASPAVGRRGSRLQQGGDPALQPPSDHARGGHGGAGEAQEGERPHRGRGRSRERPSGCTSPPPESAGSASWTSTSSTTRTCSARSRSRPRTWAGRSSRRRRSVSPGINPHIRIDGYETRLSSENALDLFRDYDVIVDGTDNFPTRYLVNDACVLSGKPNVYGSIFRFEGQVSVFDARRGPCYRCLYPEPPPPGLVPSCAEGGVLGVLPGIVGSLQALEVLKLVLERGEPMIGRLLVFDALR